MAWTYSGNPASSTKDAVRFLVGDTLSDEPLATDEEIEWALTQNSNQYAAAVFVAEGIYSYFTRQADSEEIGPIKVQFNNRVKYYAERIKTLRTMTAISSGLSVYAGGIDVADKSAQEGDTSRTTPVFSLGMNDMTSSINEDIVQ